ncbi:MAG TPA: DUF1987 domain-containing protein [Bacteroidetes bacterium]|nr:DUF1987 domain-containing protein [Bacteroidota bacterium]
MEALIIDPTRTTPLIHLDPDHGRLELSGISRPEDVRTFYCPVLEWIGRFTDELETSVARYTSDNPLTLDLRFTYFNSSSAKFLFDILSSFNEIHLSGIPVRVNWMYAEEDEDVYETGKELSEMLEMPFEYIEVP